MKIYFAGMTGLEKRERAIMKLITNRLLSFYYIGSGNESVEMREIIRMKNEDKDK